jgi:hypothetical protein
VEYGKIEYGVWDVEYGTCMWNVEYKVWDMWNMEYGIWNKAYGL